NSQPPIRAAAPSGGRESRPLWGQRSGESASGVLYHSNKVQRARAISGTRVGVKPTPIEAVSVGRCDESGMLGRSLAERVFEKLHGDRAGEECNRRVVDPQKDDGKRSGGAERLDGIGAAYVGADRPAPEREQDRRRQRAEEQRVPWHAARRKECVN